MGWTTHPTIIANAMFTRALGYDENGTDSLTRFRRWRFYRMDRNAARGLNRIHGGSPLRMETKRLQEVPGGRRVMTALVFVEA